MKIKYISVSEAKELLQNRKDDSPEEAKEFEYARSFSALSAQEAKEAVKKVMEISKLSEEICVKIVDILPGNTEQFIAILNSYKVTVNDEVLSSIIDYLKGLQ